MNKEIKILYAAISFVILSLTAGCSEENNETQQEVTVPVHVYNVKSESLTDYIKLTGTISAGKDQILFSKISERIEALYVRPGDRVNAGQVIAKQYNALLSQGVDAAKANLQNAEAQFELAQQNFNRMERLYNQRAVSTQQYEQSSTQFKAASSALEAARAQLQQAVEQFENSNIKAPFSGIVAAVFVELNQMVPAGQQVAQVIDPSTMKSKVRIPARNLKQINKGQQVVVSIPSIPGKKYNGKVTSLDQAVDPVSKTLEAEVMIPDADENLKSGMYGEFLFAADSVNETIVIPESSLLSQTEVELNKETGSQETTRKYFVYVVENNKAKMKEVKVGMKSDERVQIIEGLNFNDKVIVAGNNIVQSDQSVQIIE